MSKKKRRTHGLSVWVGAPGDRMIASLNRNIRAVVPLFSQEDREMIAPRGCGVLFTLRREYFVLSAAHVLDDLEGKVIWTAGAAHGSRLTHLTGQTIRNVPRLSQAIQPTLATRNSRADDSVDLGVMRIQSTLPPALAAEALTILDVDLVRREPQDDVFAIVGWPANRIRVAPREREVTRKFIRYAARESTADEYHAFGRDPRHHIAIRCNANDIWREGRLTDLPNLEGVSGSGMWRMESFAERLVVGDRDKLVAIFTGRVGRGSGPLVGTRVRYHIRAIGQMWPEFRPDIPLHFPSNLHHR